MSKKILSLVLSIIMLFSVLSVAASAVTDDDILTDYPVILIPGYSGTELDLVKEDGSTERVWHFGMEEVTSRILKRIVDLGKGLIATAGGNGQQLGATVGEEVVDLLGVLRCNDDGSSVNNIQIANPIAANCNMAYLTENGLDEFKGEPELFAEVSSLIGEEKCYFFTEDWRMSVLDCAARLDSFIQAVKKDSGKDKVNLVAVSHGGQVTATYLSLYGYKKDVKNAVMTVPAAGGAALAYDIVSRNVKLDTYTLVYFLEHGFVSENDYKWLMTALNTGFLNDVIEGILPYVMEVIGNFGSIWDFIPEEYYDALKTKYLDPEKNAGIIEKSDVVHHDIMRNYDKTLKDCIEKYGMNVSIIAGTGNPSVTGLSENSDAIITANDSTGAVCAPYGKRFSDGYSGLKTTCTDASHNHISPSMEVDGTTAYLPENTWYVDQLFHGMTFLDDYTRELAVTLLLTDSLTDVYSSPEYPQFHVSTNRSNAVYAYFKGNADGFVGAEHDTLVVKNLSKEYPITITAINITGAELVARPLAFVSVGPEEEIEIPVTGTLPEVSGKFIQLQIDYYTEGNKVTPTGKRVFDFTVMNGERADYNFDEPFVDSEYTAPADKILGDNATDALKKHGVYDLVTFFVDLFMAIMEMLGVVRYL